MYMLTLICGIPDSECWLRGIRSIRAPKPKRNCRQWGYKISAAKRPAHKQNFKGRQVVGGVAKEREVSKEVSQAEWGGERQLAKDSVCRKETAT